MDQFIDEKIEAQRTVPFKSEHSVMKFGQPCSEGGISSLTIYFLGHTWKLSHLCDVVQRSWL